MIYLLKNESEISYWNGTCQVIRLILSRERVELIDLSAWQSDRMLLINTAMQEELLEYLFREFKDTSGLKELFIDLSPFSKVKEG